MTSTHDFGSLLIIVFTTQLLSVQYTSAGLYNLLLRFPFRLDTCSQSYSHVSRLSRCVGLCSARRGQCVSGSHVPATGQCCLLDRYIYDSGVSFAWDVNATYFQDIAGNDELFATYDKWFMAFHSEQGKGGLTYADFVNNGIYHDFPLGGAKPGECWSTSASTPCAHSVRSKLLDLWAAGKIKPKEVKFSLYTDNSEVMNIVFNGVGSDLNSWFSGSRVISSTYSDMNPSKTYYEFSAIGWTSRHFYISDGHDPDIGWLVVFDKNDLHCDWGKGHMFPVFLYSTGNTKGPVKSGHGKADVLAIFLQL